MPSVHAECSPTERHEHLLLLTSVCDVRTDDSLTPTRTHAHTHAHARTPTPILAQLPQAPPRQAPATRGRADLLPNTSPHLLRAAPGATNVRGPSAGLATRAFARPFFPHRRVQHKVIRFILVVCCMRMRCLLCMCTGHLLCMRTCPLLCMCAQDGVLLCANASGLSHGRGKHA